MYLTSLCWLHIHWQIAEQAEFFSFGTNDLTQMTFGYSRDDVGKFLPFYLAQGILQHDPFEVNLLRLGPYHFKFVLSTTHIFITHTREHLTCLGILHVPLLIFFLYSHNLIILYLATYLLMNMPGAWSERSGGASKDCYREGSQSEA